MCGLHYPSFVHLSAIDSPVLVPLIHRNYVTSIGISICPTSVPYFIFNLCGAFNFTLDNIYLVAIILKDT